MTIIDNNVLFGNGTVLTNSFIDKNGIGVIEVKDVPKGKLGDIFTITYPEYYTFKTVNLYFNNVESIDIVINHLNNLKNKMK